MGSYCCSDENRDIKENVSKEACQYLEQCHLLRDPLKIEQNIQDIVEFIYLQLKVQTFSHLKAECQSWAGFIDLPSKSKKNQESVCLPARRFEQLIQKIQNCRQSIQNQLVMGTKLLRNRKEILKSKKVSKCKKSMYITKIELNSISNRSDLLSNPEEQSLGKNSSFSSQFCLRPKINTYQFTKSVVEMNKQEQQASGLAIELQLKNAEIENLMSKIKGLSKQKQSLLVRCDQIDDKNQSLHCALISIKKDLCSSCKGSMNELKTSLYLSTGNIT